MINLDDRILNELNESELYLICRIAQYMGSNDFAFPSVKTLSQKVGWGEKKTRKVKQSLVQKNVISAFSRYKENGGQTSDGYVVKTPLIGVFVNLQGKGVPPTQNDQGGGGQNGHPPPTQNGQGNILKEEGIKRGKEQSLFEKTDNSPDHPKAAPQNREARQSEMSADEVKLMQRLENMKKLHLIGQVKAVVERFREVTGKDVNYSTLTALKLIIHWLDEGFSPEDFEMVFRHKTADYREMNKEKWVTIPTMCRTGSGDSKSFEDHLEAAQGCQQADDYQLPDDMAPGYEQYTTWIKAYMPTLWAGGHHLTKEQWYKVKTGQHDHPQWMFYMAPESLERYFKQAHAEVSKTKFPPKGGTYGVLMAKIKDRINGKIAANS